MKDENEASSFNLSSTAIKSEPFSLEKLKTSDVLLNYAAIDDYPLQDGRLGWVSQLHRNLEVRMEQLSGEKVHIARLPDHGISPEIEGELLKHIPQAKAMISVVSPPFMNSPLCQREVEQFWQGAEHTGGRYVQDKSRLLKVLKTAVSEQQIPQPLLDIFSPLLGFEFFELDADTGRIREFDETFGPALKQRFFERVYDLAFDGCQVLSLLKQLPASRQEVSPAAPNPHRRWVYLATTTSDVTEERDRIKRELLERGHVVLPDAPLAMVSRDVETMVRDCLAKCTIAIHLLGQRYGITPEDSSESIPALQVRLSAERALATDLQRLIWVPGGAESANEFVSLLLEAATQKVVPIYVVLTMRSDFIGECGQFEGLAEMVNRGEFLIPRLNREQYKRVIEGPIKVAGGQIAPRLLQRLLNDLGQQADQLPCLQHALMRTWNIWAGKGDTEALDLDDYQRAGKMSQALSQHADEIYQSLGSDRQRKLCQGLFQALTVEETNSRGIRSPQRLGRLCQILDVSADELVPIIDAYRQSGVTFLMPSPEVELTDQTIIDISHESLMRVWTRLWQWVEEETQAFGIYRRLSESAMLFEQGKAGLYRDPELGIALAWRESRRPNAAWAARYRPGFVAAMSFLDASLKASVTEEQAREVARQRELEQAQQLAACQLGRRVTGVYEQLQLKRRQLTVRTFGRTFAVYCRQAETTFRNHLYCRVRRQNGSVSAPVEA